MTNFVKEGRNRIANILLGNLTADVYWYVGLYKNDTEPPDDASLANIIEISGSDYTRKSLPKGSWTIVDDIATFAEQTFLAGNLLWGAVTGYFIASSVDFAGKLIAVEHFTNPFFIEANKGIKFIPKVKITS